MFENHCIYIAGQLSAWNKYRKASQTAKNILLSKLNKKSANNWGLCICGNCTRIFGGGGIFMKATNKRPIKIRIRTCQPHLLFKTRNKYHYLALSCHWGLMYTPELHLNPQIKMENNRKRYLPNEASSKIVSMTMATQKGYVNNFTAFPQCNASVEFPETQLMLCT